MRSARPAALGFLGGQANNRILRGSPVVCHFSPDAGLGKILSGQGGHSLPRGRAPPSPVHEFAELFWRHSHRQIRPHDGRNVIQGSQRRLLQRMEKRLGPRLARVFGPADTLDRVSSYFRRRLNDKTHLPGPRQCLPKRETSNSAPLGCSKSLAPEPSTTALNFPPKCREQIKRGIRLALAEEH